MEKPRELCQPNEDTLDSVDQVRFRQPTPTCIIPFQQWRVSQNPGAFCQNCSLLRLFSPIATVSKSKSFQPQWP